MINESFALIITVEMRNSRTRIYTVSQINSLIKAVLGSNLPRQMTVSGEISGWKGAHSSGTCYFSLKDEGAVLPCVMWRDKFAKVKFRPENGLAIFGVGYIGVYELQGKYQFYIESMEPAGKGALWLAYEQTKNRLAKEGLFDKAHKKPLPKYPQRIGILTSESGAAIEDIKDSIWNRWPCAKLFLYPVPVQGEGAAAEIARGLRDVNRRNKKLKLDILIVGRGGGSLEDLWAFNEEVLARAIFDSQIPVISAVGHEIDTTIADLVADARASTPTKAGVVAVPDMQEVLGQLASSQKRLGSMLRGKLELCRENLQTILASAVFRNPLMPIRYREQQLDEIITNLAEDIKKLLTGGKDKLHRFYEQVVKIEPHRLLGRKAVDLNDLRSRANVGVRTIFNNRQMQLTGAENRLAGLNPKSVLQRGYSITTNKRTGLLVKDSTDVQIADSIITELGGGFLIESEVKNKQNRSK
ncbi:MAG: exodeoxyribonuclease VII large subunit [Sedimentisphaerales bacterium]|nr:exodeoxyribonuclease VII large subunit [Sedimentisphaerales bacterium]